LELRFTIKLYQNVQETKLNCWKKFQLSLENIALLSVAEYFILVYN